MSKLSVLVICSACLLNWASATAQVSPSTPSCKVTKGNDRCGQCQPALVVSPDAPAANVGDSVTLEITVKGLSKAGDCAASGGGSVSWNAGSVAELPTVAIANDDACGRGGRRIAAPASGTFILTSPPYTQAGTYFVPIEVRSSFDYRNADAYECKVTKTIKVTVKPR